jgi:formylglycine-generating enzyme required for sulfatase activity
MKREKENVVKRCVLLLLVLSIVALLLCTGKSNPLTNTSLDVPTLYSPATMATKVALTQKLVWTVSPKAAIYEVQVAMDTAFDTLVIDDSTLTDAYRTISELAGNTTYFWRVRAINGSGPSAWSSVWSFTTLIPAPTPKIPWGNAKDISVKPVLSWYPLSGNKCLYAIQLGKADTVLIDTVTFDDSLSIPVPLAYVTTYCWKVRAMYNKDTSAWSTQQTFTTAYNVPGKPQAYQPLNGATGISVYPKLAWISRPGDDRFHIQVATDAAFKMLVFEDTLSTISYYVNNLRQGITYYWRLRGINSSGAGEWSNGMSFTTMSKPVLISPVNGELNATWYPKLMWTSSSGATRYHVQVSTSSAFDDFVYNDSMRTNDSVYVYLSHTSNNFYWRVRSKYTANSYNSQEGSTDWSDVRTFTAYTIPDAPNLSLPSNNAINTGCAPTLVWNTVTGATTYQVQVSTSSAFSNFIVNDTGLKKVSELVNLPVAPICYWRVNAKNPGGTSNWSEIRALNTFTRTVSGRFVYIPGGTFQMGADYFSYSEIFESWGFSSSKVRPALPFHAVTVSSFYMDSIELTQQEYATLMDTNPSSDWFAINTADAATHSVDQVTWYDAVLYCNARSKKEGLDTVYRFTSRRDSTSYHTHACAYLGELSIDYTKNGYRLPTEAEWEYACRAGTTSNYYWGYDSATAGQYAWYHKNFTYSTLGSAKKKPNGYGLYDMCGYVSEWCNDWLGQYGSAAQTNPIGPDTGTDKIARGGYAYTSDLTDFQSGWRGFSWPSTIYPFYGIRLVRRP